MVTIREATEVDFEKIWPLFQDIVNSGNTYSYPDNISLEEAYSIWVTSSRKVYVAEEDGVILGTYKLSSNDIGRGSHVSNCGYMVDQRARGRGVASIMCEHSQKIAKQLGYKAMQFNKVVSTNKPAVCLWQKLGFDIVGTLPKAFLHKDLGYVDAYIMYKWLSD